MFTPYNNTLFIKTMINRQGQRKILQENNRKCVGTGFTYHIFTIWGNGVEKANEILDVIRRSKDIEIIYIKKIQVENIGKFVRQMYARDFVPFEHLKEKTRYLLKVKPEAFIILVKNYKPDEKYVGEGSFRHLQCMTIKKIKEKIRNKFNRRENGKRTEEHVIHSTDVEKQSDYCLKIIGIKEGLNLFKGEHSILKAPYHLDKIKDFEILKIPIDNLYCTILKKIGNKIIKKKVPVVETPHYKYLKGEKEEYKEYYEKFMGEYLLEDHSLSSFDKLIKTLTYPLFRKDISLIIVRSFSCNKFLILDGLHRAAILKSRGVKQLLVARILE